MKVSQDYTASRLRVGMVLRTVRFGTGLSRCRPLEWQPGLDTFLSGATSFVSRSLRRICNQHRYAPPSYSFKFSSPISFWLTLAEPRKNRPPVAIVSPQFQEISLPTTSTIIDGSREYLSKCYRMEVTVNSRASCVHILLRSVFLTMLQ